MDMTKPTENELFELYDKVAYMPNDGQDDPLTPFGNFCAGYEAAQQQSAGEIAELTEKLERKKSYALAITEAIIEKDMTINVLKADNERLQAQVNELHKFIYWECDVYLNGQNPEFSNKYKHLLAKTAPQCLIEHDNEVIERCALELENAEGELKYLPEYVALLRKLKG